MIATSACAVEGACGPDPSISLNVLSNVHSALLQSKDNSRTECGEKEASDPDAPGLASVHKVSRSVLHPSALLFRSTLLFV
jgi:hypothetical protein